MTAFIQLATCAAKQSQRCQSYVAAEARCDKLTFYEEYCISHAMLRQQDVHGKAMVKLTHNAIHCPER